MSRPPHASLEAAVLDAREALTNPPAERARRLTLYAAHASRLVLAERPCRPGLPEHPLAAEGRDLRARLQARFEEDLAAQAADKAAEIKGHRRRSAVWLRR